VTCYVKEETLKRFFFLRCRGYTNARIARELGVHRTQVQRWVSELKEMDDNQFMRLFWDTMTGKTYDIIGRVPGNSDVHN
jgi:transposase